MLPWKPETVHPLFVHFPIALLSTGWLCDVLGSYFRRQSLQNAGWWCLVFGVISALFTIPTGFLADGVTGHMADPFPLYSTHGIVQIAGSAIFLGLLIWRWRLKGELPEGPKLYVYHFVGAFGVVVLFYGAHLGAKLAVRI